MEAPRNQPLDRPLRAGGLALIVDDDDSCATALEQLLTEWGFQAVPFNTFQQARTYLDSATPDLAIVDVRLGNYNGLHLVHLIRQASPGAVLIAVSGFEDPVLRDEAARLGAAFLSKPWDMGQLRRLLGLAQPE